MDKLELIIGNNCKACKTVKDFLDESHISIATYSLDDDSFPLPTPPAVIPALYVSGKLWAYGARDIIQAVQKTEQV